MGWGEVKTLWVSLIYIYARECSRFGYVFGVLRCHYMGPGKVAKENPVQRVGDEMESQEYPKVCSKACTKHTPRSRRNTRVLGPHLGPHMGGPDRGYRHTGCWRCSGIGSEEESRTIQIVRYKLT